MGFMPLTHRELEKLADVMRQDVVIMLEQAGSGHSAGSLGMADIFASLYFNLLHHKPNKPDWGDRDRVILSSGHICPVWYAALARSGYFPLQRLRSLRKISGLQGHPHISSIPGVENSSGPLGQGVSFAVGMALAAKIQNKSWRTVCVMSDGEQQEGQIWEAYLFASKYKLDNITFILDRNKIQIGGNTESVMPLEPLKAKLESFGLYVLEIDGHSFEEIEDAYYKTLTIKKRPSAIIAHTIPGKGVLFMEGDYRWHGKVPNKEEVVCALQELQTD